MPSAAGSGTIPLQNQARGQGKTLGVDPYSRRNSRKTDRSTTNARQTAAS